MAAANKPITTALLLDDSAVDDIIWKQSSQKKIGWYAMTFMVFFSD